MKPASRIVVGGVNALAGEDLGLPRPIQLDQAQRKMDQGSTKRDQPVTSELSN